MKTKKQFLMIFIIAMMSFFAQGQTTVHLYLDSIQPWSQHHYCKTSVDTVVLHKRSNTTVNYWNMAIPPYDYYTDTLCIPNTYNSFSPIGIIGYYYVGGSFTFYILFDSIVVSPEIDDQIFCGNTPITLNAGSAINTTSHAKYLWSTSDTTTTFTTNTSGNYWVTISSACNLVTDSFRLDFVHVDGQACCATFDQTTQKNKILWDGTNPQGEKQIILKRNLSNILVAVDTVDFTTGQWIDLNSNPQSEESGYAVQPIDTCHNMGNVSAEMVTIWLTISEYQGDTYFTYTLGDPEQPTYQLNGIKADGQVDSLTARPASFHNILLPSSIASGYVKFYISYAINCGGTKNLLTVKSNAVSGITGIDEMTKNYIIMYPNPVENYLTIVRDSKEDMTIRIFDSFGQLIYKGENTIIDMTNYASGMYTIQLTTDKSIRSSTFIKK